MKKFVAVLLTAIIFLSCGTMDAEAAEQSSPERAILVSEACKVFPEYASVIRGENLTSAAYNSRSNSTEVAVSITRDLTDSKQLSYTEYTDGTAVVAEVEWKFDTDATDGYAKPGTNCTYHKVSYKVICNYSYGEFYLDDLQYTVYSTANDVITDVGTASTNSNSACSITQSRNNLQETNSTPAYVSHYLEFISKGALSSRNVTFTFSLDDNTAYISPNDDSF